MIAVFPFAQPSVNHPSCADFFPVLPILYLLHFALQIILPFPTLVLPSDFTYNCSSFHRTFNRSPCIAPWSQPYMFPMFHHPFSLCPSLFLCLGVMTYLDDTSVMTYLHIAFPAFRLSMPSALPYPPLSLASACSTLSPVCVFIFNQGHFTFHF